jgi:hypothetical protein
MDETMATMVEAGWLPAAIAMEMRSHGEVGNAKVP